MTAPSAFNFALACGAGGTFVDVTDDVLFEEGPITFTDGRSSQFDGLSPGTFPFTLANGDGKYTPDNPLTSLAVPLSEGMGVSMELDGLLLSGTIRSVVVIFPPMGLPATARVRVTVDDMLGNAARHALSDNFANDLVNGYAPLLWWKLDDPVGSARAFEANGNTSLTPLGDTVATFGTPGVIEPATQVLVSSSGSRTLFAALNSTLAYPVAGSLGWWGWWVTSSGSSNVRVTYAGYPSGSTTGFYLGPTTDVSGQQARLGSVSLATEVTGPLIDTTVPNYYSVHITQVNAAGTTTLYGTPYLNGTAFSAPFVLASYVGALASNAAASPTRVEMIALADTSFSHLSVTPDGPVEFPAVLPTTAEVRLLAIAATTPEIVLDTVPTMSPAILGEQEGGTSTLAAFDEVMRGEQGYLWAETTGSLLAPVETIKTLARNRQRAIDYTFDVSEILDPIPFDRSLNNTVSEFTANGPDTEATYQDRTLIPVVGSASSSDSVSLRDYIDLSAYASDRVTRGTVEGVPIKSITIDATSPNINRWADLTAIRQGHRIHITGLLLTQLGYDTWDGIVVGREIVNTQDSETHEPKTLFTFHLAPWSLVAVYGTARYSAGGTLTLQSTINSSALSVGIVSTGALFTTDAAHFPQNAEIGTEIVTLSGVTGASSPQTGTISARGVAGGSAATGWAAGTSIDVSPLPHYAF